MDWVLALDSMDYIMQTRELRYARVLPARGNLKKTKGAEIKAN